MPQGTNRHSYPEVDRLVGQRLTDREVRFTAARRLVVRALAGTAGPRSAADLHRLLDDAVPVSSLYRTLAVLDDAGVLSRQHAADGTARYELAEWITGHHHHLVCLECGAVRDVDVPPATESEVGELIEGIAATTGYEVTGHRLDIEGKCPACRTG